MISFEEFMEITDFEKHPITNDEEKIYEDAQACKTMYDLGKNGFIVPYRIAREDVYNLLYEYERIVIKDDFYNWIKKQDIAMSRDEFEKHAVKYIYINLFESRNGWYYVDLKTRLRDLLKDDSTRLKRVDQTFLTYESELFFPCACALLSLIEGALGEATNSPSTKFYELLNTLAEQNKDSILNLGASNIKGFVSEIAKSANFTTDQEPNELNRHWLLHGRSRRDIWKSDCLSLFNMFEIVLELWKGDLPCPTSPT